MESKLSQLYNKKEKERQKGEEGGKQGTKIMVFLEVTKPTLIRPVLPKEVSLFFKIYLFYSEADYLTVLQWFLPYLAWIRLGCTCVPHPESPLPPPSPSHPSGPSQCTSPEHPVSCMEPGLMIWFTYDNIHVSTRLSQSIPRSPSPAESKRLFCASVSLLQSRIQGYHYHLSTFHIYALVEWIGVFLSDLFPSV